MDFDQYFKDRMDMVARVLVDRSSDRPFARDWRLFGTGVVCVTGAMVLQLWASKSLIDPGFFARTSTFLTFVLLAGVWLLSVAQGADILIMRVAVKSRDLVVEKTLAQLLKIDSSIAHKLSGRQG